MSSSSIFLFGVQVVCVRVVCVAGLYHLVFHDMHAHLTGVGGGGGWGWGGTQLDVQ